MYYKLSLNHRIIIIIYKAFHTLVNFRFGIFNLLLLLSLSQIINNNNNKHKKMSIISYYLRTHKDHLIFFSF